MQFSKSLKHDAETRRYLIASTESGWEVREERNGEVVKRKHCSDWHRVEMARRSISIELETLRHQGWAEESPV